MAKDQQRSAARELFVVQGKTRREIADVLKVREKTVGDWARVGNWEQLRTEHLVSSESIIANLKQLVSELAQKRLDMNRNSKATAEDKRGATDELSKASKALSEARGEGEITLGTRLKVMEWVFGELRKAHKGLHDQLVDAHLALLDEAARLHA